MKIAWYAPRTDGKPGFSTQYLEAPARRIGKQRCLLYVAGGEVQVEQLGGLQRAGGREFLRGTLQMGVGRMCAHHVGDLGATVDLQRARLLGLRVDWGRGKNPGNKHREENRALTPISRTSVHGQAAARIGMLR